LSLHESSNESSGAQTLSKLLSIHGKCRVCPQSEWAHGSSDVLLWWIASCKTRNCIQKAVLQSKTLSLFIPLDNLMVKTYMSPKMSLQVACLCKFLQAFEEGAG
jgi:hypothetical protein